MMIYTQRFYRDETDYAAMRRLIAECYQLAPHPYMLLGDLDWWRALKAEPDAFLPTVPLWFAGDALVGFLWPGQGSGDHLLHPQHREAEPLLLAYAEEHLRAPAADDKPASLMQTSLESDTRRNELLAQHGFARSSDFLASNQWVFDGPPPPPQLPAGFTLSNMAVEHDYAARVQAHRAAFHPSRLTFELYMRARQMPTYRPELDLVAVAPNGDLAAYTILWFEPENRVALFEPVGCHPDYRRRGLGRAVLYEGLRLAHELGATHAYVNSWLDNSPGALLYRAAGFRSIDRWYEWRKTYAPLPAEPKASAPLAPPKPGEEP